AENFRNRRFATSGSAGPGGLACRSVGGRTAQGKRTSALAGEDSHLGSEKGLVRRSARSRSLARTRNPARRTRELLRIPQSATEGDNRMTTSNAITNCGDDMTATIHSPIDPKTAHERQMMQRVLAGETDLFYELIKPYERGVFLAATSILGNDADAEEVAQEAILKAFRHLAGFRQEAKFSTWLTQITINEAKMKLRKDRRHLYDSLDAGQENEDGDYI